MEKKTAYYGIVLFFIVYILMGMTSGLFIVASFKFSLYIYLGPIWALLYSIAMCLSLWRIKKFPKLKIWFMVLIFCCYCIPKNFFYTYSHEELVTLSKVTVYNEAIQVAFLLVFSSIAFIKYYRIKED